MSSVSVSSGVQTRWFWRSQSGRSIVCLALGAVALALCPLSVRADDSYDGTKIVTIKLKKPGPAIAAPAGAVSAFAKDAFGNQVGPIEIPITDSGFGNLSAIVTAAVAGNAALAHAQIIVPGNDDLIKIVTLHVDGYAISHGGGEAVAVSTLSAVVLGDVISVTDADGNLIPDLNLKIGDTINLGNFSNGEPGKSNVHDPMNFSLFDLNDDLLFSVDFFDSDAGTSNGASLLWDDNGMLLCGSAIGESHYSYSKAQPFGPAEVGSVSITNNVFTATGSFASLPWSVYSVGGMTKAFLPNAFLDPINEFDLTSLATPLLGMPNVQAKWVVGGGIAGTAVAVSAVPEPGSIAFGVLAAGSTLGLIARKRKA